MSVSMARDQSVTSVYSWFTPLSLQLLVDEYMRTAEEYSEDVKSNL